MESKLGEIINANGILLKVVLGHSCNGCYFWNKRGCCTKLSSSVYECTYMDREDKQSVIFKEVKDDDN